MKQFFVMSLLSCMCFAGSLTITGPGSIPLEETSAADKTMHQFFRDFTDALKNELAKIPQSELKSYWKLEMNLIHGTAASSVIPEHMEFALTNGGAVEYDFAIPYCAVDKEQPAHLAHRYVGKFREYMIPGKP